MRPMPTADGLAGMIKKQKPNNMKKLIFLLSLAVLAGASKCQQEVGNTFEPGKAFVLKMGEMAKCTCKSVAVRFVEVTEDSRCPKNTNCVWAGEVKTRLDINGTMHELKLGGDGKATTPMEVDNYTIQLMEVNPYPVAGEKIDPASYVATIMVKEK